MAEEEGMDFAKAFRDRLGNSTFGMDTAGTEARLQRERRAGLTAKQRAARKKNPPKTQKNFRASDATLAQIDALSKRLNKSITDIVAMAIDALAERELGART
jgi:hypothetical protein